MTEDYSKIVPTAWLVAYRRKFSDVPYSKEIFEELDRLRKEKFFEVKDEMLSEYLAPQYEARYKLIDKCIIADKFTQILEIAAGFAGRGLAMSEDPKIKYVEFDLPRVMQDKERIANNIVKRNNLYFEQGNALNYDDLQNAVKHFEKKPITIINEGFLRYLSFEEKATVAINIHKLLENYGGTWITSDITLKKLLSVENDLKVHNKTIEKMTGVNVDNNRFENEEHAMRFFNDLGYSIERHSFNEVRDELVSPKELKQAEEDVEKLIGSAVVYVMRIKD